MTEEEKFEKIVEELENPDKLVTLVSKVPAKEKEYIRANTKISGKVRHIVESWNETEREMGIRDDLDVANLAILKSYRNAIAKNVQVMQSQLDKLDRKIADIEGDEENEVLFTVKLDLDGAKL